MAFVPAALIGLTLALYLIVLRYHDADIVLAERGALLARQLASAAEYGAFSGNAAELRRLAESVRHEADVTAVVFQNREGMVLASVGSPTLERSTAFLPDRWQSVSRDGMTLYFNSRIRRTAPEFDDPFVSAGAPSSRAEADAFQALLGGVTVEMSRASVIASQRETLFVTTSIFLVALLIGTLLGRRLSRDVIEPIVALQKAVTQIHDGNLDVRVPRHRGGALHILEDGVNEMAAALSAERGHLEACIADATRELREQKEDAERTNLAKSRFLAAASHDLRQPLHALALFVAELEHQPNSLPQRRLLKNIGNAVDALNHQFSALLDISRLDLAETAAHPETFALAPLIDRVIAVHAQAARTKGLRLRHVRSQLWTRSDPRLLERMLGNLLSNAIRYTDKGGIVIGVRRSGDSLLRIEVIDSGIGIDGTQVPLIFQEFYQVGNPERDAEKGLGLGLSIVRRMAQMLGHRLEVASRPGHGSTFRIILPRAASLCAPALPPEPPASDFPRLDFDIDALVFCEAGADRVKLCDLLERWGCSIACADSDAAHDEKIARKPGLVICDPSHAAIAKGFIDSFQTAPPLLVVLGSLPEDMAGLVPPSHVFALPLRPARLRALLQQLLHAADADESRRNEDPWRVQQVLR